MIRADLANRYIWHWCGASEYDLEAQRIKADAKTDDGS